jgi:hypothetical protein
MIGFYKHVAPNGADNHYINGYRLKLLLDRKCFLCFVGALDLWKILLPAHLFADEGSIGASCL